MLSKKDLVYGVHCSSSYKCSVALRSGLGQLAHQRRQTIKFAHWDIVMLEQVSAYLTPVKGLVKTYNNIMIAQKSIPYNCVPLILQQQFGDEARML